MSELVGGWRERLRNDLTGFADPGAEPRVAVDGTSLHVAWITRGVEHEALFGLHPEGHLEWLTASKEGATYVDFLGSGNLADLQQLAAATAAAVSRRQDFIASNASLQTVEHAEEMLATPADLASWLDEARVQTQGRTNLMFVKGDPGAGKTTLLRETTALQALRHKDGAGTFLCLFVSAQGRELSNLRDAFSGELQDLRAGFTRDAIAPLARAGLLVPVIDGFDELLGTAGYSGAFGSLQSLLEELAGLGTVVVSARSAFYDLEFLKRSASAANEANISTTTMSLAPWTSAQLRDYLQQQAPALAEPTLSGLSEEDHRLLRRPLFASQFPGFSAAREEGAEVGLLDYLIDRYIQREAEKIVDGTGEPVLRADGHRRLFELAAEDMWQSEARELAADDLRALAEIVAEEYGLGADASQQLVTKITSYAGFRPARGRLGDKFTFEHEVYFDYFLAQAFARYFRDTDLPQLLGALDRGVVPEAVIRQAVDGLEAGSAFPEGLETCPRGLRFANRRRNLGTVVVAFARRGGIGALNLRDLAFEDVPFGRARFHETSFLGCDFVGVDWRETQFVGCVGGTSRFQTLRVDNTTRIEIDGLRAGDNVGSIHHDAVGDLYSPRDVGAVLERLGAPVEMGARRPAYSTHAMGMVNLLQRLARAYRRTNIIYERDEFLKKEFGSPFWADLQRLLLEFGIVTQEMRVTAGRPGAAYRLRVRLDDLLSGENAQELPSGPVGDLWRALRKG